jgi:hypothetical protein
MNNGMGRLSMAFSLCLLFLVGATVQASAKVPEGYRDIKLGMNRSQVVELLQKSPIHFSYDDIGGEIGEIVRGDDLFRFATYKFDKDGVLVEIGLQMREVLGRDRCLEMYNSQHGIQVSPLKSTTDANVTLEVKENSIIMKKNSGKDTRSASRGSAS